MKPTPRHSRTKASRLVGTLGRVGALGAGLALLAGCASSNPASSGVTTEYSGSFVQQTPGQVVVDWPAGAAVDYQLGGAYEPDAGVGIVVRDSAETPAPGVYSICYVNGFQTQPGAEWPEELILHDASGAEVFDPGWPDERILDSSTAEKREGIVRQLTAVVGHCASDGYQAVEFDNLDSYTRSDGALNVADAEALATLLVGLAHDNGLDAGQKNTAELGDRGRTTIGFDFAVAEECQRFDECAVYTDVYGDRVIDIEYTDDLGGTVAEVCNDPQLPASTVIRDRDLVPVGDEGYELQRCS
ncbi:Glycoside-hydrolase family GH114 [Okibacterium fritillariae]|uniref:Glycoside-hydrolase family GH114 n=2 Tax=Okibacterium fritillariae TaxID=123320 RepID=A0A1T5KXW3_9MICO|nr:Glycoside-hydrolase family GH114 [Okibacterium fritillariae]